MNPRRSFSANDGQKVLEWHYGSLKKRLVHVQSEVMSIDEHRTLRLLRDKKFGQAVKFARFRAMNTPRRKRFLEDTRAMTDRGVEHIRICIIDRKQLSRPEVRDYWQTMAIEFLCVNVPLAGEKVYFVTPEQIESLGFDHDYLFLDHSTVSTTEYDEAKSHVTGRTFVSNASSREGRILVDEKFLRLDKILELISDLEPLSGDQLVGLGLFEKHVAALIDQYTRVDPTRSGSSQRGVALGA